MPDAFTSASRVRDVVARSGDRGKELLLKHGYDLGDGFVDVLSQYQTLENAARQDRLRDLDGLLQELNAGA